jgi:pimeloyl-ACP methyl ester carboxylesterase
VNATVVDSRLAVGGFTFTAHTAGEPGAPLVLLLHGFPQTRHSWRHQLAPLAAAGYRVIAPDQRGYSPGARPSGRAEYATNLLVDDALGLASVGGGKRFHLVGHDWGGQIAWLIAARYPERVASLTVLSRPHPRAFAEAMQNDPAQAERSKHHRAFQDDNTAARLLENGAHRLRESLAAQGVAPDDVDAYLRVLGEPAALEAALDWYRATGEGGSALVLRDVPSVRVPTLYLWGNADATVGRAAAVATARFVDAAYRFVELDDVGHFITDQRIAEVNEPLLEHLHATD